MSRFARTPSVLLGLIGQGIQGSRTPEMQMREAEAQGLRCVYRLIDLTALNLEVDALPDLLTGLNPIAYHGVNNTQPAKRPINRHNPQITPFSRRLRPVS